MLSGLDMHGMVSVKGNLITGSAESALQQQEP